MLIISEKRPGLTVTYRDMSIEEGHGMIITELATYCASRHDEQKQYKPKLLPQRTCVTDQNSHHLRRTSNTFASTCLS
jgi:hypothetical protein